MNKYLMGTESCELSSQMFIDICVHCKSYPTCSLCIMININININNCMIPKDQPPSNAYIYVLKF